MKTIGQVLKSLREQKHWTINDISIETKIDPKLIEHLENDEFEYLPSSTFTKGFIVNYAKTLNFPSEKALAVFRRDFNVTQSGKILPKGLAQPLDRKTFLGSKIFSLIFIGLLIITFLAYLLWQVKNYRLPPQISISRPKANSVVKGPRISVKGFVSANASVYVNGEIANLFPTGEFLANIQLPIGEQNIVIKAIDQNNKVSELIIPVIVVDN